VLLMAVVTFQLLRSASSSTASRISLATLGMQAALDAYLTLGHVLGGLATPAVFSSFVTAAFVFLMLFAMLELKFMQIVWKARQPDAFAGGWDAAHRELGLLYAKFYLAVVAGLFVIWLGGAAGARAVALVAFSFWLPQIVHSVQHDSRPGFAPAFVLASAGLRLLMPAYLLACPDNLLLMLTPAEARADALAWTQGWAAGGQAWLPLDGAVPPPPLPPPGTHYAAASPAAAALADENLRFFAVLAAWTAVTTAVVFLQGKSGWGPRWFVPWAFLPQRYDYHRALTIVDGRIAPDHAACAAWLRPREAQQQAAVAAAAAAAAGAGRGRRRRRGRKRKATSTRMSRSRGWATLQRRPST
jgi:hypothetical protein